MSHAPVPRAAHIRHARAGGFAGAGGGFSNIDQILSDIADAGHKHTTKTKATIPASVAPSLPSTPPASSSAPVPVSSSSPLASSPSAPPSSTPSAPSAPPNPPVTATYYGSALHNNMNMTTVVYHTATASTTPSVAAAVTSNQPTPAPTNALVAPVIGGVAGGILGLAGLIFLLTFCVRRRKKEQDAINFDPSAFRRSAVLLNDPPTHKDTIARGYNPPVPPPVMVEKNPIYAGPASYPSPSPGYTPTSKVVFEAPFSPIITPGAASPAAAGYDRNWGAPPPVITRNPSASSASSAHAPAQYAQYPALPNSQNLAVNEREYVDLERSSVTPFQAAQYAEISHRLNSEVPKGLDTPAVDQFVSQIPTKDDELPPLPKDPFTDDAAENNDAAQGAEEYQEITLPKVQDLSFPAPPSPVITNSSRYRVDSMPPTLPEIVVQPRVSVTSTYLSEAGSAAGTPYSPAFPSGQTVFMKSPFAESPMGSRFPVTPSPLASSFTVPTPPAQQTSFATPPATPSAAAVIPRPDAAQPRPDAKNRQSTHTLYDPEDAYGGF